MLTSLRSFFCAVFICPGVYYHPENQQMFFEFFRKWLQYDVYASIQFIFDNRLKINSNIWIKQCIIFIAMMTENDYVIPCPKFEVDCKKNSTPGIFSEIVKLSYESEELAKHIWEELLPAAWKTLGEEEKRKISTSDGMQQLISQVSDNEYGFILNSCDVFINALLKCDPIFFFSVNQKHIEKSFDFQVQAGLVMEKHISRENILKNDKRVNILNLVLTHLEEMDTYYYFNKDYVKRESTAVKAMLHFQNGHFIEACCAYKEVIRKLENEIMSASISVSHSDIIDNDELAFCRNELTRCEKELTLWTLCSIEDEEQIQLGEESSLSMNNIQIFKKWNFEELSKMLLIQSDPSKTSRIIEESDLHNIFMQCIWTWWSLPRTCLSQKHYSLLQLIQQLLECIEIKNLDNINDYKNHPIEKFYSKWVKRSYLLSDDLVFVTELLHFREVSLKILNSKLLQEMPNKNIDITNFLKCSNDAKMELYTVAVKFQAKVVDNLKLKWCSRQSVFKLCQAKFLSLLKRIKKNYEPVTREEATEHIKKAAILMKYGQDNKLDPDDYQKLDVYFLNVLNSVGVATIIEVSKAAESNPGSSSVLEVLADCLERHHHVRKNAEIPILVLKCLLKSCKFGDPSIAFRVLPKILHILQFENEDNEMAEALEDIRIPAQYWLPFLPFLISRLYHCLMEENVQMECELFSSNERSQVLLSNVISDILCQIGVVYPQQLFFELQYLKQPSDKKLIKKYLDIVKKIRSSCPTVINTLEKIAKDFEKFIPSSSELVLCFLKNVLEKANYFVIKNVKKYMNDTKEFLCYLEKTVKLEIPEIGSFLSSLKEIDKYKFTMQDIIHLLQQDILSWSKKSDCQKESFYLDAKCLFLSNFHHFPDMDINVFSQSPLTAFAKTPFMVLQESTSVEPAMDCMVDEQPEPGNKKNLFEVHDQENSSKRKRVYEQGHDELMPGQWQRLSVHTSLYVKIYKFLPKVDVHHWNGSVFYKISILGHDGKVYPFIVKYVDTLQNPSETFKVLKCMQTLENLNMFLANNAECSKRFLKFHFTRTTLINDQLMLIPLQGGLLSYQDIFEKHKTNESLFSSVDAFVSHLFKFKEFSETEMSNLFKTMDKYAPEDSFKNYVEHLYPGPLESYLFKKQFTKHISMLVAAEYLLNLSSKKDLAILEDSGTVSTLQLELDFDVSYSSALLTPNIRSFIGSLRVQAMTENIYWISQCFKEHFQTIEAYLLSIEEECSKEEAEKMAAYFQKSFMKRFCSSRSEIQTHLEKMNILHGINPLTCPWF